MPYIELLCVGVSKMIVMYAAYAGPLTQTSTMSADPKHQSLPLSSPKRKALKRVNLNKLLRLLGSASKAKQTTVSPNIPQQPSAISQNRRSVRDTTIASPLNVEPLRFAQTPVANPSKPDVFCFTSHDPMLSGEGTSAEGRTVCTYLLHPATYADLDGC
jgi:hypothetical protein